jgi:hypothetical protein
MAEVYKVLYQGQPGTSAATAYTVPAVTSAIVKHIRCANMNAAGVETIKEFVNGTAAGNCVLNATEIPAGGSLEQDVTWTLAAGDTIALQASAGTTVTVTIFGIEIS